MRRRELITLLGGAAVAWPLAARAQQVAKRYLVGILSAGGGGVQAALDSAFFRWFAGVGMGRREKAFFNERGGVRG